MLLYVRYVIKKGFNFFAGKKSPIIYGKNAETNQARETSETSCRRAARRNPLVSLYLLLFFLFYINLP